MKVMPLMRVVAALVIAIASLAIASPAAAHERRMVGPYQFVVGWLNEPAYQGEPNGASVRITDPRVSPPKPMEGLADALTIEVRSGGLSTALSGRPRAVFGQPGLYSLDIIPTAAGAYTYTIRGKVEGLDFNERFESGPGRFNDVEAQSELQYPAKVPAGGELNDRLAAIERQLGTVQALAIVALALAVVLSLANAVRRRRT